MPKKGCREEWISVLAEQIGCSCRPSAEVAAMIQEAVDARRQRGKGKETWISAYVETHRAFFGCDPDVGPLLKAAKKVEQELGREGAIASHRAYCREMQNRAVYLSYPKWASTCGAYRIGAPL